MEGGAGRERLGVAPLIEMGPGPYTHTPAGFTRLFSNRHPANCQLLTANWIGRYPFLSLTQQLRVRPLPVPNT